MVPSLLDGKMVGGSSLRLTESCLEPALGHVLEDSMVGVSGVEMAEVVCRGRGA